MIYITIILVEEFNGHIYTWDSMWLRFDTAVSFASAKTPINGLVPHIATITSADEHAYMKDQFTWYSGWIGISDQLVEGTFRVVTGPETGSAVSFAAWASGEPNNEGGDEDCVDFNYGSWNDVPCYLIEFGYFVEYDCPGVLIPGAYGCLCKSFAWSLSILAFFFVFLCINF
jgi:hypothetical protein